MNYIFLFEVLVLTVLATLVKYTTDEYEVRILYEYLAEASVVFPKVEYKIAIRWGFDSSYSCVIMLYLSFIILIYLAHSPFCW